MAHQWQRQDIAGHAGQDQEPDGDEEGDGPHDDLDQHPRPLGCARVLRLEPVGGRVALGQRQGRSLDGALVNRRGHSARCRSRFAGGRGFPLCVQAAVCRGPACSDGLPPCVSRYSDGRMSSRRCDLTPEPWAPRLAQWGGSRPAGSSINRRMGASGWGGGFGSWPRGCEVRCFAASVVVRVRQE